MEDVFPSTMLHNPGLENNVWEQTVRFPLVIILQYVKTIKFIDRSHGLFGVFSRTVLHVGRVNLSN